MSAARLQIRRWTPLTLAAFVVAIATPKAGLYVHEHTGGDHAHVHLGSASHTEDHDQPYQSLALELGYHGAATHHHHEHGLHHHHEGETRLSSHPVAARPEARQSDSPGSSSGELARRLPPAPTYTIAGKHRQPQIQEAGPPHWRHWHEFNPFHRVIAPTVLALTHASFVQLLPPADTHDLIDPFAIAARARAPQHRTAPPTI